MEHLKLDQRSLFSFPPGLRLLPYWSQQRPSLSLLVGFAAFALIPKNLDDIAERLTEALRVNAERKLSSLFLILANRATDETLWVLAIGAPAHTTARSIEAFGLWREREWAQWFALFVFAATGSQLD